jgi:hypothetical protein
VTEHGNSTRAWRSREEKPSAAWALGALPLAAGDDEGMGKLIFAVIFAIIWGISALASMLNKKKQSLQRQKLNDLVLSVQRRPRPQGGPGQPMQQVRPMPMPRPMRRTDPGEFHPPPPPLHREPLPPRQAPKQPQLRAKLVMGPKVARPPQVRPRQPVRQVRRGPLQPVPPRPPSRLAVQEEEGPQGPRRVADTPPPTAAPPAPLPAGQAGHGSPSIAQASAITKWLRPRTLRQQFILTELLQPPMAFRPPQDI